MSDTQKILNEYLLEDLTPDARDYHEMSKDYFYNLDRNDQIDLVLEYIKGTVKHGRISELNEFLLGAVKYAVECTEYKLKKGV